MRIMMTAAAAALLSTGALAQQAAPIGAPATGSAVLRVGTEVPLRLSETLTTKEKVARVGQRFRVEVAEDVKVGGQTVIPAGTPGVGEITDVRNKGMWGKSGHISARLLYVQVNGRQIRLTGTFDEKGTTGTAGVVAAIAFVPVAGFFTTGTSATIPTGAGVKGFIDEDVPLAFAAPAAGPMAVPTAPMALPVATAPVPTAAVATPAVATTVK